MSILAIVMDGLFSKECDDDTASILSASICDLEVEGLWERDSEEHFRFSHDQIQSAAFQLIPADKRDRFRGSTGSIMMTKLNSDELETHLFGIVSLRNCDVSTIALEEERLELAKLNLRAGMKVRRIMLSRLNLTNNIIICFKCRHMRMQGLIQLRCILKQVMSYVDGMRIQLPCKSYAQRGHALVSPMVTMSR